MSIILLFALAIASLLVNDYQDEGQSRHATILHTKQQNNPGDTSPFNIPVSVESHLALIHQGYCNKAMILQVNQSDKVIIIKEMIKYCPRYAIQGLYELDNWDICWKLFRESSLRTLGTYKVPLAQLLLKQNIFQKSSSACVVCSNVTQFIDNFNFLFHDNWKIPVFQSALVNNNYAVALVVLYELPYTDVKTILEQSSSVYRQLLLNKLQEIRDVCPICLDENCHSFRVNTKCYHSFHLQCIEKWKGSCPMCRLDDYKSWTT